MAGCACPTAEEQPTHLWPCWAAGIQGLVAPGWAGPGGGLAPGFYRVASRQGLSERAGARQLAASLQMLGENLVFPKDKWVASGTSCRWSWLTFRVTTLVWRLCASAVYFPGPLVASPVRLLC